MLENNVSQWTLYPRNVSMQTGRFGDCHTGIISLPTSSSFYDSLERLSAFYDPIHPYACAVICVAGVIMNSTIVFVLSRKEMQTPVNVLLAFIALCDSLVMCSYLVFMIHFQILAMERCQPSDFTFSWAVFALFHLHLTVVAHSSSLWISVAMAQIRHSTLVWAEKGASRMITSYQAAMVSLAIILLVCVAETPLFLSYSVKPLSLRDTPSMCRMMNSTALTTNDTGTYMVTPVLSDGTCLIVQLSFWTNGLVFKIIPCLLLTIFIILLLRVLRNVRRRRIQLRTASMQSEGQSGIAPDRTTRMLITLLVIFLITEIPQGVLAFLSGICSREFRTLVYNKLGNILDLLSLINSGNNFIILCTMSRQFRQTFLQLFTTKRFYTLLARTDRNVVEMTTVIKNRAAIRLLGKHDERVAALDEMNHSPDGSVNMQTNYHS